MGRKLHRRRQEVETTPTVVARVTVGWGRRGRRRVRKLGGGADGEEAEDFEIGRDGVVAYVPLVGGPGEDNAGVRCVSARTQTQPIFGLKMGQSGQQSIHRSILRCRLGCGFCPDGHKWMRVDEMRWLIVVALTGQEK